MKRQVASRGDVYHLNFAPAAGREQVGPHYGVVVSPRAYNAVSGMPFVAPVTTVGNASRMHGFAVSLSGTGLSVTGVVQVDQTNRSTSRPAARGPAARPYLPTSWTKSWPASRRSSRARNSAAPRAACDDRSRKTDTKP